MLRELNTLSGARLQPTASGGLLLYQCRITLNSYWKLSNLPEPPLLEWRFSRNR